LHRGKSGVGSTLAEGGEDGMMMGKRVHWIVLILGLGIVGGMLIIGGYAKPVQAEAVSEPPANTGEDLKAALKSQKPVLVDFGANKCIPCRQIRPILREIGKEYAGKAHVLIIDVWELRELARDYRIQLIPTLIFFDPSGKEVFRRSGTWDKNSMIEKLKEAGMK
jgi:thioredoxin 1